MTDRGGTGWMGGRGRTGGRGDFLPIQPIQPFLP
jgi:hypothetical protein